MGVTLVHYQVFNVKTQQYEDVYLPSTSPVPTVGPTGDAIDPTKTVQDIVQASAPVNDNNVPIVETAIRKGEPGTEPFMTVSHDFTDRTTWYQNSVQLTAQPLTDSGDGLTFNSQTQNWVNINSPKLSLDYNGVLTNTGAVVNASQWTNVIYVNGTPADPSTYTVNYASGSVTFGQTQSGQTVTADLWHNNVPNASDFLFIPPPGFLFRIGEVAIQASQMLNITTPIQYQIWAGGTTLADYGDYNMNLFNAGYGQALTIFRNFWDLINWFDVSPPVPPPTGFTAPVLTFIYYFVVGIEIRSDLNMVMRVNCMNDIPLVGDIASFTADIELVPLTDIDNPVVTNTPSN
jgi:hypothetical protein